MTEMTEAQQRHKQFHSTTALAARLHNDENGALWMFRAWPDRQEAAPVTWSPLPDAFCKIDVKRS
jgi:hypothetical protein